MYCEYIVHPQKKKKKKNISSSKNNWGCCAFFNLSFYLFSSPWIFTMEPDHILKPFSQTTITKNVETKAKILLKSLAPRSWGNEHKPKYPKTQ